MKILQHTFYMHGICRVQGLLSMRVAQCGFPNMGNANCWNSNMLEFWCERVAMCEGYRVWGLQCLGAAVYDCCRVGE